MESCFTDSGLDGAVLKGFVIINAAFVMKFGKNKIKVEKNSGFGYNNGSFHAENQLHEKCAEEYLLELLRKIRKYKGFMICLNTK